MGRNSGAIDMTAELEPVLDLIQYFQIIYGKNIFIIIFHIIYINFINILCTLQFNFQTIISIGVLRNANVGKYI